MVSCPKTPVPACAQVNIAPSEATQFIKRTHDFFSTVVPRLGSYPLISLSFLSLFVDRHPFASLDFLIIPPKMGKFLKWCLDFLFRWRFNQFRPQSRRGSLTNPSSLISRWFLPRFPTYLSIVHSMVPNRLRILRSAWSSLATTTMAHPTGATSLY